MADGVVVRAAWINLLFDLYGGLLTEHQRSVIELYYGQDLSLSEIAAEYNISRQAVHETLKRAELALEQYEEKLGLASRYLEQRRSLLFLLELAEKKLAAGDRETASRQEWEAVKEVVLDLLEKL